MVIDDGHMTSIMQAGQRMCVRTKSVLRSRLLLKFSTAVRQEELAVELSMNLLSCLEEEDLYDEDFVPEILELFNAIAHAGGGGREKYAFINRAILYSSSPEQPYGDVRLHRAAADMYWRDGRYGLCQGHLIFCKDAPALAMMLRQWQKEGYMRERPLFWLRVVLLLLCLKDTETAEHVLRLSEQDWNSPYVPAPFQLAYLLVEACKSKDQRFFLLLQHKYHLILRRDEFFFKCLNEIEKRVIGRHLQQQPRYP
ncbi:Golgi to ER traffic protein 4 homolog, partial [Ochotona princeps]|uniref:Golgi to ER traffic protein 4 homolog n=1 Tax=Ochotona princeps TaxID=9978 RepID=UPI00271452E9